MKKKKSSQSKSKQYTQSTAHLKKSPHSHVVFIRPLLAVIWGIVSTYFTFSLLFDLCFYPARDFCTTPYQWLTIIPWYKELLVLTVGLPTFIADLIFEVFSITRFGETERLWLPFSLVSIIVAYFIIIGIHSVIKLLRKVNT